MKKLWATFCILSWTAAATYAGMLPRVDVPERIQKSDKVVVASVTAVQPRWETNSFGDKLIISRYTLRVEEDLKGIHEDAAEMDVEGGTLDGLTLAVSVSPKVQIGDRAVFLLDKKIDKKGKHVYKPHIHALGMLHLDHTDHVKGSTLRLDDIRHMAKRP